MQCPYIIFTIITSRFYLKNWLIGHLLKYNIWLLLPFVCDFSINSECFYSEKNCVSRHKFHTFKLMIIIFLVPSSFFQIYFIHLFVGPISIMPSVSEHNFVNWCLISQVEWHPNSTLIGIFGILPNIRKKGENPIVCDIVQLYACVSVATHSDHDFLACGGRVPNILMRVALNCSQLPFVCGSIWHGMQFLYFNQVTQLFNQLVFKWFTLVSNYFFWPSIMDQEVFPQCFCYTWGSLLRCNKCLGISCEVICDHKYVDILVRSLFSNS